jgi:Ca2+-binding EF-hand superfamily protein
LINLKFSQKFKVIIKMTFYEKKIKTFFSRFDTNKNGTVELDDFNQWSTRLAKERGLDAQKSSNLAKNMAEIWRFFFFTC